MALSSGLLGNRRGFTLIELLVVVLIIGVLAAMGITQFSKTMETAKAEDAVAIARAIANANRMWALDHSGVYLAGNISGCDPAGTAGACASSTNPCDLMWCGYLVRQDLRCDSCSSTGPKGYTFEAVQPGADRVAARAKRTSTANEPFNTWVITATRDGVVATSGTDPPRIQ